jgi:hypothetical protein
MMRSVSTPILLFFFLGCGAAPDPAPAPSASGPAAPTTAPVGTVAPPSETAPATQASAILPNDGTRQIGDVTRCPVTQDVFTVTADGFQATHEDKTYPVCCRGCVEKFAQNPARFLSP